MLPAINKPTMPEADVRRLIADRYGDRASGLSRLGAGEWSRARALTAHRATSVFCGVVLVADSDHPAEA